MFISRCFQLNVAEVRKTWLRRFYQQNFYESVETNEKEGKTNRRRLKWLKMKQQQGHHAMWAKCSVRQTLGKLVLLWPLLFHWSFRTIIFFYQRSSNCFFFLSFIYESCFLIVVKCFLWKLYHKILSSYFMKVVPWNVVESILRKVVS